MNQRRIVRGEKVAPGLVLTRDLGSLKKGRVLSEADVRAIDAAAWKELDVLELEAGDVHEEAAGRRLASAVAGDGVGVGEIDGGSFPLVARRRGLVALDARRLRDVNLVPDLAAYAHPQDYVAVEGDVIGRAKVVPFVTREQRVRQAEEIASGGLVRVRPFVPARGALLVHEQIAEVALEKARLSFHEKLSFFGSRLETARSVSGNPRALAEALAGEQRAGAQLIVLAGSRSIERAAVWRSDSGPCAQSPQPRRPGIARCRARRGQSALRRSRAHRAAHPRMTVLRQRWHGVAYRVTGSRSPDLAHRRP